MTIKGWLFHEEVVKKGVNNITQLLGRKITKDELQELAQLWDWNYDDIDVVEMLQKHMTAEEYDAIYNGL